MCCWRRVRCCARARRRRRHPRCPSWPHCWTWSRLARSPMWFRSTRSTENDARERAGLAPFNGLWLWGAGAAITPATRVDAYATAGAEGDLARGIALASGGRVHALGDRLALDANADAAAVVVVALPPTVSASLAACDAGWLAPATAALARGALSRLTLVADGAGTHRWTATTPTWRARLMARLRASRFGVPA